jgi:hypothetical protein
MNRCFVHFNSWAGTTMHECEFLGETPSGRYRVRLLERAFRHPKGTTLYPPKSAVTFPKKEANDAQ